MARPLIHPSLLTSLGDFFPQTVTIQQATNAQDAVGEMLATWVDLAGHVALPCLLSPEKDGKEVKRKDMTYSVSSHRFLLKGHYTSITTAMRAVSGGINYDILAVEHDSQSTTTRLLCQVVT